MSRYTHIATGSNTTVVSTAGNLYSVHIDRGNGGTVLLADSTDLGATPNYNTDPTAVIRRIGTIADAGPHEYDFKGVHFDNGLTVAASSSASVTVYWSV